MQDIQENEITLLVDQILATIENEATIEEKKCESKNTDESAESEELDFDIYESTDSEENDQIEQTPPSWDILININKGNTRNTRTMNQWLLWDKLIVHPVWIGNLPAMATTNVLRNFIELYLGQGILVTVNICDKRTRNQKETTYAFINLPTAEKQLLTVTILDGKIFMKEKLIVRPLRPSKYPKRIFNLVNYSNSFIHFKDYVMNQILSNPTDLSVTYVSEILENNNVQIDSLPSELWLIQCSLVPNCHRQYCPFYHNNKENELGKIICLIKTSNESINCSIHQKFKYHDTDNGMNSKDILLLKCLPSSFTSEYLRETFEIFGEIDCVIFHPCYPCYIKMKREADARKIVALCKDNNDGVIVDFASHNAIELIMWWFSERPQLICFGYMRETQKQIPLTYAFPMPLIHYIVEYYCRLGTIGC